MAKKIAVVLGTRPEAIKLAPVIVALKNCPDLVTRVCSTGQHREMLDQVFKVFDMKPDLELRLMQSNQTLAGLTARMIEALDGYYADEKPDLVLVQGDTTTVLCSAIAAFYRKVPIGHVEAGLRTGNLQAPWPEEANRVITTRLTRLHFAPTQSACENLLREGVQRETVYVTGNTVIDALFQALQKVQKHPPRIPELPEALQPGPFAANGAPKMVLITGHRRENFGQGFEEICHAIGGLAQEFSNVHFVYPVHLNPNVREPVRKILRKAATGSMLANVHLIEPLAYLEFVALMSRATIILTDSGGVQEEAPSLGKPVLVMRETTERPEAVNAGTVRLVGSDRDRIIAGVRTLLSDPTAYAAMSRAENPYGDGHAAERILTACRRFLNPSELP